MVLATGFVTALPAYVATLAAPSGSAVEVVSTLALALIASLAAAKVGAALWMRHPLARDVVFADLMAWEWLRRLWVERRLAHAQAAVSDGDAAPHARAEALARLARLLEARDAYTHGHSKRVARHALRISQALRLPADDAATIWTAATLHDVGKIHTPREILNKPGRLSDAEFDVIKRHPVDGAAMLAEIGDPRIVAIVRSHHERLDGAGYPDGLAGSEIPLGARIIAVADTFDALTSTRSYRSAATHKRALDILRKEAGTQLDGAAVAAFLRTYSGRRPAAWSALVTLGPERAMAWVGHQATSVASLAPAAGWIAPIAAVAAALAGTSSHATDQAAQRSSGAATPIAAVHSAASKVGRGAAPQAQPVPQTHVTVPAVTVHGHAPRRPGESPAASVAGAGTPGQTAATAAGDAVSTATPGVTVPSSHPDVTTVTSVVAGVKVPSPPALRIPAVNAASEAVETPPVALPAVPEVVATVLHDPATLAQSTVDTIVTAP
jgi:putative nucleotidyltransferase with HDIG domain